MTITGPLFPSAPLPARARDLGAALDRAALDRATYPGPLGLGRWMGRAPAAWCVPGWRRALAGWAIAGALGDLVTTISIGHVDGIAEANPLSAAGQALVGSTPAYMVATTVVVLLLVSILPVRPVDGPTRVVWWAIAILAVAKIAVAVANLTVLQGALDASIDRL